MLQPKEKWVELRNVTPPIVTEEVFEAVQRQLQINKKEKRRTVKHEYLLRGFIRCGNCGRLFHPHQTRQYKRYSCTSIQNPAVNCHTKTLNAGHAEESVWIEVLKIIGGLTVPDRPPTKTGTDPLPLIEKQIANLEREMCLIVDRSATADKRAWEIFQAKIQQKADELEKLQVHRESIMKEMSRQPKALSLKDVQKEYRKRVNNLPFDQRVKLLKDIGLVCTWDGEELKINIYAW